MIPADEAHAAIFDDERERRVDGRLRRRRHFTIEHFAAILGIAQLPPSVDDVAGRRIVNTPCHE